MRKGTSASGKRERLVEVNQEVLRALLDDRRMTIADLARRTRELEQTLAHLVNVPGARCKASRRTKIARALAVPEELLAGEPFPVPVGFMLPDGFEFRYSARTQLAASRFIARVRRALLRDLKGADAKGRRPSAAPGPIVESAVLSTVSELMMIGEWRKRFIEWNPGEHERRGYTEPPTVRPWEGDIHAKADATGRVTWETAAPHRERDDEHEAAILGVIRAMEHVFAPWLEGKARLNYRSLRDFVHLPHHPFANAAESIDPMSPFAILPPPNALLPEPQKPQRKK